MKKLITLLLMNLLFISMLSCQEAVDTKKADLTGTWVYSQPAEEELGFTMTVDGQKVDTEPEERGEDRYYLVFDNEENLIEYKVVFGFRSKYSVASDTLSINGEPFYKIIALTADSLTLKQLNEPKTITYAKTDQDVSDIPIMN